MMYIYLATPMQISNRIDNLRRAINAAERIEIRGHTVFLPHLNEIWHLIYPHSDNFWMKRDFEWIRKCDILVRLDGKSHGSDEEVKFAKALGRPTFGSETENGLQEFINSKYWGQQSE